MGGGEEVRQQAAQEKQLDPPLTDDEKQGGPVSIEKLALSDDGKRALVAYWCGVRTFSAFLKLWDAEAGKPLLTIKEVSAPVNAVAFLPDGATAFASDINGTFYFLDAYTGKLKRTIKAYNHSMGRGFIGDWIAFSQNRRFALSLGRDEEKDFFEGPGHLKLWDLENGVMLSDVSAGGEGRPALSADNSLALLAPFDARQRGALLVQVRTGKILHTFPKGWSWPAAFSPDARHAVLGRARLHKAPDEYRSDPRDLAVWNLIEGKQTAEATDALYLHRDDLPLHFSDNLQLIIPQRDAKNPSNLARLNYWDLTTGKITKTVPIGPVGVGSLAFTSDGKRIILYDQSVRTQIWETEAGRKLKEWRDLTASFERRDEPTRTFEEK